MDKTFYERNGYNVLRAALSGDEVKELNTIIDDLLITLKPSETVFQESTTGKIKQIQYLYKYHTKFQDLIHLFLPIVQGLVGEKDFYVLNMQLFEKHPGISKATRPHQDNAYFRMEPATPVTVWISLDDIDEENGCIYYYPYLNISLPHNRYNNTTTFRIRSGVPGLSLCIRPDLAGEGVPMITKPGDVLIHNCNAIHSAGPNLSSDRRRRAIGIVFIPNSCKKDRVLEEYYNKKLQEDIQLQLENQLQNKSENQMKNQTEKRVRLVSKL